MSNPLAGPVDLAAIRAVLGPQTDYVFLYQSSFLVAAGISLILGGVAMQLLGGLVVKGDMLRSHRIAVGALFGLILIKTFAELAAIYTIGFLRFGSFRAFYLESVTAGAFNYLAAAVVQLLFVHRLSVLYRGNLFIVVPLVVLALAGLAFGFITLAYLASIVAADVPFDPTVTAFKWRYLTSVCIPAVVDFAITGAFLWRYRTLAKESSQQGVARVMRRLVYITLESNLLTGIFVFTAMLLALTDVPVYYAAIGPLYAISLAVNLSSREGTRKQLYADSHAKSSAPPTAARSPSKLQPRSPHSTLESGERLRIRSAPNHVTTITFDASATMHDDEKPGKLDREPPSPA